jgi:hypothetical protein
MEASKLQVKVFADTNERLALEAFIPIFHRWVKNHTLDELLIDVANYAHVHRGPGVALIGHESDYFMEEGDGRPGLLLSRKRKVAAAELRLPDAFGRALGAAALLERDAGAKAASPSGRPLRFRTNDFLFRINDRLLAPNSDATFGAVRPALEALCAKLFAGGAYVLTSVGTPKQLFSVRITTSTPADLATLLARLGAAR